MYDDGAIAEVVDRLIERREMLGMSRREVAERIDTHQSSISLFERKVRPPDWKFLTKWARALRMDVRIGVLLNCKEWDEPFFADLTPEVQ